MGKISCNVIKDILPLYVDDVVSEDTKKLVEEHLAECSDCTKEMESLKKQIKIPVDNGTSALKKFKKKFFHKKVLISCISILVTLIILSVIFHYEIPINYSKGLVTVETSKEGKPESYFHGNNYHGVHSWNFTVNIDGTQKNVVYIYYDKTLWNSISPKNGINNKEDNIFPLENNGYRITESENGTLPKVLKDPKISEVYYMVFDRNSLTPKNNEESIKFYEDSIKLKKATLLWKK